MRVTAIIVTHESGDVLHECIRHARASGCDSVQVVDNMSSDDGPDIAEAEGCALIRMPSNTGFARACNAGARAADGDIVCFLNPDCIVDAPTIDAARRVIGADPRRLLVPDFRSADDRVQSGRRAGYTRTRLLADMLEERPGGHRIIRLLERVPWFDDASWHWPLGACLLADRRRFIGMGGFDEDFFLYMEDVVLGQQWCAAGGRVESTGTVVVHAGCSGSSIDDRRRRTLLTGARVRYARRSWGRATAHAFARVAGHPRGSA
jgi:N-acetylglucosaminyl-diphospho-decaprenol L-rhamnosyltransferase